MLVSPLDKALNRMNFGWSIKNSLGMIIILGIFFRKIVFYLINKKHNQVSIICVPYLTWGKILIFKFLINLAYTSGKYDIYWCWFKLLFMEIYWWIASIMKLWMIVKWRLIWWDKINIHRGQRCCMYELSYHIEDYHHLTKEVI